MYRKTLVVCLLIFCWAGCSSQEGQEESIDIKDTSVEIRMTRYQGNSVYGWDQYRDALSFATERENDDWPPQEVRVDEEQMWIHLASDPNTNFTSLADALDAAIDNDVIELSAGFFALAGEDDDFYVRKPITIRGQGMDATWIQTRKTVFWNDEDINQIRIENLTFEVDRCWEHQEYVEYVKYIDEGEMNATYFNFDNCNLVVKECRFICDGRHYLGMYLGPKAHLHFEDCLFVSKNGSWYINGPGLGDPLVADWEEENPFEYIGRLTVRRCGFLDTSIHFNGYSSTDVDGERKYPKRTFEYGQINNLNQRATIRFEENVFYGCKDLIPLRSLVEWPETCPVQFNVDNTWSYKKYIPLFAFERNLILPDVDSYESDLALTLDTERLLEDIQGFKDNVIVSPSSIEIENAGDLRTASAEDGTLCLYQKDTKGNIYVDPNQKESFLTTNEPQTPVYSYLILAQLGYSPSVDEYQIIDHNDVELANGDISRTITYSDSEGEHSETVTFSSGTNPTCSFMKLSPEFYEDRQEKIDRAVRKLWSMLVARYRSADYAEQRVDAYWALLDYLNQWPGDKNARQFEQQCRQDVIDDLMYLGKTENKHLDTYAYLRAAWLEGKDLPDEGTDGWKAFQETLSELIYEIKVEAEGPGVESQPDAQRICQAINEPLQILMNQQFRGLQDLRLRIPNVGKTMKLNAVLEEIDIEVDVWDSNFPVRYYVNSINESAVQECKELNDERNKLLAQLNSVQQEMTANYPEYKTVTISPAPQTSQYGYKPTARDKVEAMMTSQWRIESSSTPSAPEPIKREVLVSGDEAAYEKASSQARSLESQLAQLENEIERQQDSVSQTEVKIYYHPCRLYSKGSAQWGYYNIYTKSLNDSEEEFVLENEIDKHIFGTTNPVESEYESMPSMDIQAKTPVLASDDYFRDVSKKQFTKWVVTDVFEKQTAMLKNMSEKDKILVLLSVFPVSELRQHWEHVGDKGLKTLLESMILDAEE